MNSIDIKLEKTNAISRYRSLHMLTTLFRIIETFIFLILMSKFSFQLPFSVTLSHDRIKLILLVMFSPKFVFVIGNVIVLILLFNSRFIKTEDHTETIDCSDDYVTRCQKNDIIRKISRSKSDNAMRVTCKENRRYMKLRRSVTERKISMTSDTMVPKKNCVEDELSGDEFRRTVEAFIARQKQSLRDQELVLVPYDGV